MVVWLPFGLVVYRRRLSGLRRRGGELSEWAAGRPEWIAAFVLVGLLIVGAALAWLVHFGAGAEKATGFWEVIGRDGKKVALCAAVIFFLRARGVRLAEFAGRSKLRARRVIGLGLWLSVAMFPLVMTAFGASLFACHAFGFKPPTPALFPEIAGVPHRATFLVHFAGVVLLAPFAEEVLYRGYLYRVFKTRLGAAASAILVSLFFAAVHLNVTAFVPIFVVSLCLTIAYEASGSLRVPIFMHALANFVGCLPYWLRG
ncbi:MAG: CPBP family intramembrane metalloprotease [Verrucomicrobia bacterium]|nr:CPBP family intramembrane metalloprotease [Verrucomicrobiota bacterium]